MYKATHQIRNHLQYYFVYYNFYVSFYEHKGTTRRKVFWRVCRNGTILKKAFCSYFTSIRRTLIHKSMKSQDAILLKDTNWSLWNSQNTKFFCAGINTVNNHSERIFVMPERIDWLSGYKFTQLYSVNKHWWKKWFQLMNEY